MPSRRAFLADVNLWLATVLEQHPHHRAATHWWQATVAASKHRVVFCRITQLGLVRLLGNEMVMGEQKQTPAQAWELQRELRDQPLVGYADEPERLEAVLESFTKLPGSARGFWTDAYLAAFAEAGGFTLATFDRGFQRFPRLELALLS